MIAPFVKKKIQIKNSLTDEHVRFTTDCHLLDGFEHSLVSNDPVLGWFLELAF